MRRYLAPMLITARSLVNKPIRNFEKKMAITEKKMEMRVVILRVAINPALTLSILFAPIFCPTKVDKAAEKFIAGSEASESIRIAME